MAHQIVDYLQKDCFTCAICIDRLKDPKMLPCAHTFCSRCLKDLPSGPSLTCPTCRKNTVLTVDGVGGLPSSFLVKNLMEKVDVIKKSETSASSCNFCQGMKDVHFCIDCKLNVCTRCRALHDKIPGTTNHITVPIERLSDEEYMKRIRASHIPRCDKHKEEKLAFFCLSCRKLSCRDCKILDHSDHRVVTADEGHSSVRNKLQSLMELAVDESKSMAETAKSINSLINQVQSHVASVKEKVEQEYKVVIERCKADRDKLLEKITIEGQKNINSLEEVLTKVQKRVREMDATQKHTLKILDENIKWNVLQEGNLLVDTLRKLSEDERRLGSAKFNTKVKSFFSKSSLKRGFPENFLGTVCDGDSSSFGMFGKPKKFAKLDVNPAFVSATPSGTGSGQTVPSFTPPSSGPSSRQLNNLTSSGLNRTETESSGEQADVFGASSIQPAFGSESFSFSSPVFQGGPRI